MSLPLSYIFFIYDAHSFPLSFFLSLSQEESELKKRLEDLIRREKELSGQGLLNTIFHAHVLIMHVQVHDVYTVAYVQLSIFECSYVPVGGFFHKMSLEKLLIF